MNQVSARGVAEVTRHNDMHVAGVVILLVTLCLVGSTALAEEIDAPIDTLGLRVGEIRLQILDIFTIDEVAAALEVAKTV